MASANARSEAWERSPQDTPKSWEAFNIYLNLGPGRSLRAAGQALGKSTVLLETWSRNHAWVVRAAAWDAEQQRIAALAHAEEIRKYAREAAKNGAALADWGARGLLTKKPEAAKEADLIRAVETGHRVQAQALGVPTSVQLTGPGGGPIQTVAVDQLSDDDKRALLAAALVEAQARLAPVEASEPHEPVSQDVGPDST